MARPPAPERARSLAERGGPATVLPAGEQAPARAHPLLAQVTGEVLPAGRG